MSIIFKKEGVRSLCEYNRLIEKSSHQELTELLKEPVFRETPAWEPGQRKQVQYEIRCAIQHMEEAEMRLERARNRIDNAEPESTGYQE